MQGNILRFSGYGWGQQRHNQDTPAHVKGWSYTNTAKNYRVVDNLFDSAAYRSLHLVALKESSLPVMQGNIYIQTEGKLLGQYGANEQEEPSTLIFDKNAEETIKTTFCDLTAKVLLRR
jgi:hypothetical protein